MFAVKRFLIALLLAALAGSFFSGGTKKVYDFEKDSYYQFE
ncbi:MAG: hypothetical protein XD58_1064 [Thermotoga sp. 50_1627]|nr:MAG: hypothetical protein XD45_1336 [Thermotoga sp. 50_64]KUK24947.1 MAG: hypothetical protein XD58_1064 [Thermotoga sp. 50_1627]MDK2922754.1 hypothetical protein [Pseudothermotoga sp.]